MIPPLYSVHESGTGTPHGQVPKISRDILLYVERLFYMTPTTNFTVHVARNNETFSVLFDDSDAAPYTFKLTTEGARNVWLCMRLCQIAKSDYKVWLESNKDMDYTGTNSPPATD